MKTDVIRVRLTEQEKAILKERAAAAKMTMSDYVKYCCLISPPPIKKEDDEHD